jgi:urease accessory protein
MSMGAALLLLADGRLPSGGYAHSGGLESAVRMGEVHDTSTLEAFLHARAVSVGLVSGAFAAAAHAAASQPALLDELDRALDARMPAAAARTTSRALGRQLGRVLRSIHPDPLLENLSHQAHQAIAYGVAAASLGLATADAARLMVHETVAGPAAAAAKVLSVDPFEVHAILVRLVPVLDETSRLAAEAALQDPQDLPAPATPLLDVLAELHAHREVRLFAS